jgi:hypothetical protein
VRAGNLSPLVSLKYSPESGVPIARAIRPVKGKFAPECKGDEIGSDWCVSYHQA